MTDRSLPSDSNQIDVDPYSDDTGGLGALFGEEVGDDISDLLSDPSMWSQPSDGLGDQIAAAVASEANVGVAGHAGVGTVVSMSRFRRLRPVVLGAAAAIAVVFGGIVVLSAIAGNPTPEEFSSPLVPTGLVPDAEGEVAVTSLQSGLRIELDAPSLPRRADGEFYEGWLRLDDGRLVPIGTFHEGDGVTLWAGIELDKVIGMTITLEAAVAADSPEQASSGNVVLKLDFPSP